MSISIGELVGTISLQDQFSGPINNVAKALGVSSDSFRAVTGFASIAVGAIAGVTAAAIALGQRGSDVEDVRQSFDSLSQSAGSTAAAMLGALQEGTLGTISNFDLMSAANGVLSSGLVSSADDMKTLAAGAKMLADRTGGDTATAFDKLTSSMATGRTGALKQMGVFVDSKVAIEEYADSIGKSVGSLTDHERATAMSQATLAALKTQLDKAGPATLDFADKVARGKVAIQNLTDNLGVAIATSPVVAAGMDAIGKGIEAAFGDSKGDQVKTLQGFVADFAIGLTYVAQGALTVASVFATVWSGIQTVVLGVVTAISVLGTGIVSLVSGLAEMAAKIPGVGDSLDGFAGGAAALAASMQDVTTGLAEQTAEAAKGVVGNSDLHRTIDALAGGVMLARDRMVELSTAQAAVAETNPKQGITDTGTAIAQTAAEVKAYQDAMDAAVTAADTLAQQGAEKFAQLQSEVNLLQLSGLDLRFAQLEAANKRELETLANTNDVESQMYQDQFTLIGEKYALMTSQAIDAYAGINAASTDSAFQRMSNEEQAAAVAITNAMAIAASGKASAQQIALAWAKAYELMGKVEDIHSEAALKRFDMIAKAASSVITSIFGKNKSAAIAGAIIDTAAAVVSSFKNAGGWPWGLIPAAAMAAAGFAEISNIRSQNFAQGTPDTAFLDFGRVASVNLHNHEAVINRAQGDTLEEQLVGAVAMRDETTARELRGMRDDLSRIFNGLPIMMTDAWIRATA